MTNETPRGPDAGPTGQARNALCACGSGEKYKRCCGALSEQPKAPGEPSARLPAEVREVIDVSRGSRLFRAHDISNQPQHPFAVRAPGTIGSSPDPQAAQTLFRRGVQLLLSGQPFASIPILQEAIRSDADYFDAHHALGAALLRTGRFAEASPVLLRAVTLRPAAATAWQDLGTSYYYQSLHDKAIEAYRKALELSPKLDGALSRLGEIYAMYSRMAEASDCFERAADVKPNTTKARLLRSDALMLRGDLPGAEDVARKAVALDRASDAVHGNLAGLLYAQGRFEEAAKSYEAAIRLNPKAVRCWLGLTQCRKFSSSDTEILDRMRAVSLRDDLNDAERMTMHFALGKAYDDREDYGLAMEQFDAANRLRARDLKFDRATLAALVDRNIQRFTTDFIASHAASGNPDQKPLFIVGMYRSGTTLVEQIVSSHLDVIAGGELTVWTPLDLEIDPMTGDLDPERARSAIARYLSVLQTIGPSAARVTDKLPFNFFRLGAIHALLPQARIIHCQRDPIDTCLSIYTNLFKSRVNFAARKDDLVFVYQQYLRMMDHWRNVLPPEIFTDVPYERLIADREAETRRLIAFAGLDWNDSCLRPEQNDRAISTASAWQARQPVYATSMQRWRHYEPWLGELRQLVSAETRDRT